MRRSFTTPFNCTSKSYWKLRFNFTQCLFEHGVFLRPLSCFLSSIWICRGAGCIWCSSGISWPKCSSVKIEVKMNFVRRVQSRLRCNSYKTAKWKACVSKESARQHDSGHKETICLGQPNMLSQIFVRYWLRYSGLGHCHQQAVVNHTPCLANNLYDCVMCPHHSKDPENTHPSKRIL